MSLVRHRWVLVLLAVLSSIPIAAQDSAAFGFLVRQPQRGRAVPILPANSIRFIEAQYDVGGDTVEVFIATSPAPQGVASGDSDDWTPMDCASVTMQRFLRSSMDRYVAMSNRERYTLYISTSVDTEIVCRFAASFIDTFEFFLDELEGELSEGPPPEFPAVIDLTQ
ncbi:MAG: hypothetical protein ACOCU4_03635 [Alkalispirochaeta sp.]